MKRKHLALLATALVLSACAGGGGGGGSSTSSAKLTVAIGIDPDTMDPMRQTTTTVQNIVSMVVE
ncbi:MAG TPA: phosphoesterase, partial [Candidatus Dormibacteraeota bacterium]|nr:phosphoesterase [Candidatus Dormibacteraeota bacterium]